MWFRGAYVLVNGVRRQSEFSEESFRKEVGLLMLVLVSIFRYCFYVRVFVWVGGDCKLIHGYFSTSV